MKKLNVYYYLKSQRFFKKKRKKKEVVVLDSSSVKLRMLAKPFWFVILSSLGNNEILWVGI